MFSHIHLLHIFNYLIYKYGWLFVWNRVYLGCTMTEVNYITYLFLLTYTDHRLILYYLILFNNLRDTDAQNMCAFHLWSNIHKLQRGYIFYTLSSIQCSFMRFFISLGLYYRYLLSDKLATNLQRLVSTQLTLYKGERQLNKSAELR